MTLRRIPTAVTLTIGLAMGWTLAHIRSPTARAVGGDRYGDYTLAAGPVSLQYNELTKTQAAQDAIYFLDYRGARLLATVPILRQTNSGSQLIDGFVERDLAADFKIDLERGPAPHFLMTPGSLGAYGDGWAPMYVFETTTRQVAVYKIAPQSVGARSQSRFELLELKSFATPLPRPAP